MLSRRDAGILNCLQPETSMEPTWHIAYTNPRSEISACVHLSAAGYRAFAPHFYERQPGNKRTPHIEHYVRRQAFPRYAFIGVISPNDNPFRAKSCVGVHSLLMSVDKPAVVSSAFMARLMARCEGDGWMRELDGKAVDRNRRKVGDVVPIAGNLLYGIIKHIADLDGMDLYDVEIEMFGAKRMARVSESGIAAANTAERP